MNQNNINNSDFNNHHAYSHRHHSRHHANSNNWHPSPNHSRHNISPNHPPSDIPGNQLHHLPHRLRANTLKDTLLISRVSNKSNTLNYSQTKKKDEFRNRLNSKLLSQRQSSPGRLLSGVGESFNTSITHRPEMEPGQFSGAKNFYNAQTSSYQRKEVSMASGFELEEESEIKNYEIENFPMNNSGQYFSNFEVTNTKNCDDICFQSQENLNINPSMQKSGRRSYKIRRGSHCLEASRIDQKDPRPSFGIPEEVKETSAERQGLQNPPNLEKNIIPINPEKRDSYDQKPLRELIHPHSHRRRRSIPRNTNPEAKTSRFQHRVKNIHSKKYSCTNTLKTNSGTLFSIPITHNTQSNTFIHQNIGFSSFRSKIRPDFKPGFIADFSTQMHKQSTHHRLAITKDLIKDPSLIKTLVTFSSLTKELNFMESLKEVIALNHYLSLLGFLYFVSSLIYSENSVGLENFLNKVKSLRFKVLGSRGDKKLETFALRIENLLKSRKISCKEATKYLFNMLADETSFNLNGIDVVSEVKHCFMNENEGLCSTLQKEARNKKEFIEFFEDLPQINYQDEKGLREKLYQQLLNGLRNFFDQLSHALEIPIFLFFKVFSGAPSPKFYQLGLSYDNMKYERDRVILCLELDDSCPEKRSFELKPTLLCTRSHNLKNEAVLNKDPLSDPKYKPERPRRDKKSGRKSLARKLFLSDDQEFLHNQHKKPSKNWKRRINNASEYIKKCGKRIEHDLDKAAGLKSPFSKQTFGQNLEDKKGEILIDYAKEGRGATTRRGRSNVDERSCQEMVNDSETGQMVKPCNYISLDVHGRQERRRGVDPSLTTQTTTTMSNIAPMLMAGALGTIGTFQTESHHIKPFQTNQTDLQSKVDEVGSSRGGMINLDDGAADDSTHYRLEHIGVNEASGAPGSSSRGMSDAEDVSGSARDLKIRSYTTYTNNQSSELWSKDGRVFKPIKQKKRGKGTNESSDMGLSSPSKLRSDEFSVLGPRRRNGQKFERSYNRSRNRSSGAEDSAMYPLPSDAANNHSNKDNVFAKREKAFLMQTRQLEEVRMDVGSPMTSRELTSFQSESNGMISSKNSVFQGGAGTNVPSKSGTNLTNLVCGRGDLEYETIDYGTSDDHSMSMSRYQDSRVNKKDLAEDHTHWYEDHSRREIEKEDASLHLQDSQVTPPIKTTSTNRAVSRLKTSPFCHYDEPLRPVTTRDIINIDKVEVCPPDNQPDMFNHKYKRFTHKPRTERSGRSERGQGAANGGLEGSGRGSAAEEGPGAPVGGRGTRRSVDDETESGRMKNQLLGVVDVSDTVSRTTSAHISNISKSPFNCSNRAPSGKSRSRSRQKGRGTGGRRYGDCSNEADDGGVAKVTGRGNHVGGGPRTERFNCEQSGVSHEDKDRRLSEDKAIQTERDYHRRGGLVSKGVGVNISPHTFNYPPQNHQEVPPQQQQHIESPQNRNQRQEPRFHTSRYVYSSKNNSNSPYQTNSGYRTNRLERGRTNAQNTTPEPVQPLTDAHRLSFSRERALPPNQPQPPKILENHHNDTVEPPAKPSTTERDPLITPRGATTNPNNLNNTISYNSKNTYRRLTDYKVDIGSEVKYNIHSFRIQNKIYGREGVKSNLRNHNTSARYSSRADSRDLRNSSRGSRTRGVDACLGECQTTRDRYADIHNYRRIDLHPLSIRRIPGSAVRERSLSQQRSAFGDYSNQKSLGIRRDAGRSRSPSYGYTQRYAGQSKFEDNRRLTLGAAPGAESVERAQRSYTKSSFREHSVDCVSKQQRDSTRRAFNMSQPVFAAEKFNTSMRFETSKKTNSGSKFGHPALNNPIQAAPLPDYSVPSNRNLGAIDFSKIEFAEKIPSVFHTSRPGELSARPSHVSGRSRRADSRSIEKRNRRESTNMFNTSNSKSTRSNIVSQPMWARMGDPAIHNTVSTPTGLNKVFMAPRRSQHSTLDDRAENGGNDDFGCTEEIFGFKDGAYYPIERPRASNRRHVRNRSDFGRLSTRGYNEYSQANNDGCSRSRSRNRSNSTNRARKPLPDMRKKGIFDTSDRISYTATSQEDEYTRSFIDHNYPRNDRNQAPNTHRSPHFEKSMDRYRGPKMHQDVPYTSRNNEIGDRGEIVPQPNPPNTYRSKWDERKARKRKTLNQHSPLFGDAEKEVGTYSHEELKRRLAEINQKIKENMLSGWDVGMEDKSSSKNKSQFEDSSSLWDGVSEGKGTFGGDISEESGNESDGLVDVFTKSGGAVCVGAGYRGGGGEFRLPLKDINGLLNFMDYNYRRFFDMKNC